MRYLIVLVATFIYLCLEVALNYKLLNTAGVYSSSFDMRDIEVVGRSLSAFGAVLFVWMFFVKKSAFNIGFLKIRVRLIGLIAAFFLIYPFIFPVFYNGIEKVVDKVAESSDQDSRLNAAYSNLFRQGFLVGKYPLPESLDPNSPEAKTYFALLSYYSYEYGSPDAYDKLVGDAMAIQSLNASLSSAPLYGQYQKLTASAEDIWSKYKEANNTYNFKVSGKKNKVKSDYNDFIADTKHSYDSGMREVGRKLNGDDGKLLRFVAKEKIWLGIRMERNILSYSQFDREVSPSEKWKKFNEAVFKTSYDFIAKALQKEAGFSSDDVSVDWRKFIFDLRVNSCSPQYGDQGKYDQPKKRIAIVQHRGWSDGERPTVNRYVSDDYSTFKNWKHMGYSHGGNHLVCNVTDKAFDSFYYNVVYAMVEKKYGFHPYKHRTWDRFANDPATSARIVQKFPAEYRSVIPKGWVITDYETLKRVSHSEIQQVASDAWDSKTSGYNLKGLQPNLSKNDFFSAPMVVRLLKDASYGMYYASMPHNLSENEFKRIILPKMVSSSVSKFNEAHKNSELLTNGGDLSEFGMSNIKAFIVPVIALLLSLTMVFINIVNLSFMIISAVSHSRLKKGLIIGLVATLVLFSTYVYMRPNPMSESPLYTRLYEHKKESHPVLARSIHGLFLLQPVIYGLGEKVYPVANALVFNRIIENEQERRNEEMSDKINSVRH